MQEPPSVAGLSGLEMPQREKTMFLANRGGGDHYVAASQPAGGGLTFLALSYYGRGWELLPPAMSGLERTVMPPSFTAFGSFTRSTPHWLLEGSRDSQAPVFQEQRLRKVMRLARAQGLAAPGGDPAGEPSLLLLWQQGRSSQEMTSCLTFSEAPCGIPAH